MTKMELIFDAKKTKNEDVHKALNNVLKKLPDEFVYSATFSLVSDAIRGKSNIFLIKDNLHKDKKIYLEFKKAD